MVVGSATSRFLGNADNQQSRYRQPSFRSSRVHTAMIKNRFRRLNLRFLFLSAFTAVCPGGIAWSQSSWESGHGFVESELPLNALRERTHSHHILRSPEKTLPQKKNTSGKHATTEYHSSKRLVHPPFSPYRRRMQPDPPTLPGANQRETWKTPYSYGYFGASGTRHWSLHHGYRDRYTEWRLK